VARGGRRASDRESLTDAIRIAPGPSSSTGPLVLVVDDFPDGREMTAEYLRFRGFRVEEARNGAEAIEKATLLLPDIVLMDLLLPDMDGVAVIAQLRQAEKTSDIRIAVYTAQVLGDVRRRISALGIRTFIPKPCELEVLVRQLAYLMEPTA
jgi:two-component system cell cycle response regulator DivK